MFKVGTDGGRPLNLKAHRLRLKRLIWVMGAEGTDLNLTFPTWAAESIPRSICGS